MFAPGEEACEMLIGAAVGWPNLVFCRKHEAGKTRTCLHKFQDVSCVEKFWGTTPMRCTQEQCWVTCPVARRSSCIGRKRRETWKSFADFCSKTDGLDSPRWTSRFSESCGRRLKKYRRCFTTTRFQVRRCQSTWKTSWPEASVNPCRVNMRSQVSFLRTFSL